VCFAPVRLALLTIKGLEMKKCLSRWCLLSCFLFNTIGMAYAEEAGTTSQYGDWAYTCAVPDKKETCYLHQKILDKSSNKDIAVLQIAKSDDGKSTLLTAILPLGMHFPSSVNITVDKSSPLKLTLQTCLPIGCIANLALDRSAIRMLASGKVLEINFFANAGKQAVALKSSLSGLGDGLKASNLSSSWPF
jgi:invasion protein IalB